MRLDMTTVSDVTSATSTTCASMEDAWKLAKRLSHLLDSLAADAVEREHYELRVAGALVGSAADELEAALHRGTDGA
jgi:hypothetical protein